jgi:hypothetical protein
VGAVIFISGFFGSAAAMYVFDRRYPAKCPVCGGPAYVVGSHHFVLVYRCTHCSQTTDTALRLRL